MFIATTARSAGTPEEPDGTLADAPETAMAVPPALNLGSVKRLSDGEMTCTQLYHEVAQLETQTAASQAEVDQYHKEITESTNKMMNGSSAPQTIGMASGLLGMIPGVGGVVGNLVAQTATTAATNAATSNIRESQQRMMNAQQRMMASQQALAIAGARREHLTELFLKKGCKTSELQKSRRAN